MSKKNKKTEEMIDNNEEKTKKKNVKSKKRKRSRKQRRKTKRKGKKIILIIILLIILITFGGLLYYHDKENKKEIYRTNLQKEISNHYNKYVITIKDSDLYKLENNEYLKSGKIAKGQELTLKEKEITYQDEYLEVSTFDDSYYIYYKDIEKLEELSKISSRHKKYIVWNSNVITNDKTNFYDEEDNLIYSFDKSFEFPIIIKKDDIYGVEYNDRLFYIKKEDVKEIVDSNNTDKSNTKGIAIMNYHFFFNAEDPSDQCNQGICLSTQNLRKHLDYIKNNDIFTPSMKELEMYIDGYIRLPKSVVLTIDDGWRAGIGSEVITEYELNATIFLMSKYYDPRNYQNEYIEVHSHGYDIHNAGVCPGGQGGAIKCLEKSKLLEDLNASRDKLNNTTYFCYPFYEYNDYSISVLKEAGFTMAFGGYYEAGNLRAYPGINKFKLPRYVIMNYTSANDLAKYIG